jgi:hypothetical protein
MSKLLLELKVIASEPIEDKEGKRETDKETGAPLFRVYEEVKGERVVAGKTVSTTDVVGHKSLLDLKEGKHIVEVKQAIIAQSFGRPNVYYRILAEFGKETQSNKKAA